MLQIGQKVQVRGDFGVVRFVGTTEFSSGVWVGVELDTAAGKNDGAVGGQRYFVCLKEGTCGIFVRPTVVKHVSRRSETPKTEVSPSEGSSQSSDTLILSEVSPRPDEIHISDSFKDDDSKSEINLRLPGDSNPKSPVGINDKRLNSSPESRVEHPLETAGLSPTPPVSLCSKETDHHLQTIIHTLQKKLHAIHLDTESYKLQVSTLNSANITLKEKLAVADESRELDTISRELLEGDLEQLQERYDDLLSKYDDLQLEFIDLQEELRLQEELEEGDSDVTALSKRNKLLELALLKLKDMSQQKELTLLGQLSQYEVGYRRSVELEAMYSEASQRLERTERLVDELRGQLELVPHSETVVDTLTERNIELAEKVSALQLTVLELEQMQEVDRDLEATHLEVEGDLRAELSALTRQLAESSLVIDELRGVNNYMDKRLASMNAGTFDKPAREENDSEGLSREITRLKQRIFDLESRATEAQIDAAIAQSEVPILNELVGALRGLTATDRRFDLCYEARLAANKTRCLLEVLPLFEDYPPTIIEMIRLQLTCVHAACDLARYHLEFGVDCLLFVRDIAARVEMLVSSARQNQLEVKITQEIHRECELFCELLTLIPREHLLYRVREAAACNAYCLVLANRVALERPGLLNKIEAKSKLVHKLQTTGEVLADALGVLVKAQSEMCGVEGEMSGDYKPLLAYLTEEGNALDLDATMISDEPVSVLEPVPVLELGSLESEWRFLDTIKASLSTLVVGGQVPQKAVWNVEQEMTTDDTEVTALRLQVQEITHKFRTKELLIEELGIKIQVMDHKLAKSKAVEAELAEARKNLARYEAENVQVGSHVKELLQKNQIYAQALKELKNKSNRIVGNFHDIYQEKEKASRNSLISEIHTLRRIILRSCELSYDHTDLKWLQQDLSPAKLCRGYRTRFNMLGRSLVRAIERYETIPYADQSSKTALRYYLSRMEEDYSWYRLERELLY
ncbi:hypothetical protein BABINDRAFT_159102 [Babjeviella inositovora NRRL Y-12698]|uniref:CAP-Gly domain-containing protein n=1 Tax=Babjeviella inositovora NRRL Y-12698 TaxID=984486 RepID=A0A1E3QY13_9ASCO|nr:uncharacterized protein BABINDRAFT_159102 [Babjeviella inositovora NRRL Y-12698]ODQ82533.1 hypothetical protein BABINDRAFT_159102 [Babjeviella inositovora NRRL Y-12698]